MRRRYSSEMAHAHIMPAAGSQMLLRCFVALSFTALSNYQVHHRLNSRMWVTGVSKLVPSTGFGQGKGLWAELQNLRLAMLHTG